MSLVCSLTGCPPKDPVVNPEGIVFDRSAIQEHLVSSDNCPVTGSRLTELSLQDVRNSPSFIEPCTGTMQRSVPTFLNLFLAEFDKSALLNRRLLEDLDRARAELVHLRTEQIASMELIKGLQEEIASHKQEINQLQNEIGNSIHSYRQ